MTCVSTKNSSEGEAFQELSNLRPPSSVFACKSEVPFRGQPRDDGLISANVRLCALAPQSGPAALGQELHRAPCPVFRLAAEGRTMQYARLVDEWVTGIGLRREDYGTHSLRRTKAAIIYRATGNLRAVQILLGHAKIESTVRYLGVDVEDALMLAEATEV